MRRSLRARVVGVAVRKEAAEKSGGTSFSQSVTLEGARWLSSTLLPSLAHIWTHLRLEGSFHPLNAHCVHTALLLPGCRSLGTQKIVPWIYGVLFSTA